MGAACRDEDGVAWTLTNHIWFYPVFGEKSLEHNGGYIHHLQVYDISEICESFFSQKLSEDIRYCCWEDVPDRVTRTPVWELRGPDHQIQGVRYVHVELGGAVVFVVLHGPVRIVHLVSYAKFN
jgi:hypothetical protein